MECSVATKGLPLLHLTFDITEDVVIFIDVSECVVKGHRTEY